MRDDEDRRLSRRSWLVGGSAAVLIAGCAGRAAGAGSEPTHAGTHAGSEGNEGKDEDEGEGEGAEAEVTPAEDLMREHGVLRRVMYVFDEAAHRLETSAALPLDALAAGATLVRKVIEDYHEKLEEQHLFPRFEKAGVLVDLVAVLRRQHQAGRAITSQVLALSGARLADADRATLARALRAFPHMYRPHAAREDTVLFPALHRLVGGKAYHELGEQFEDIEKDTLGEGGFEKAVIEVARIEAAFGVDDLAKLTPQT